MKVYLVDDEPKALELLVTYVKRIEYFDLIGTSRSSIKALAFLRNNIVDVLFLDVNMPLLTGVELVKSLSPRPHVIFTTAHPEYAVEGFNLELVDYLLKPISFSRFVKTCERINRIKGAPRQPLNQKLDYDHDTLYLKSGPVTHKLSWKDVLYVQKDENYVVYYTSSQKILCRQSLVELEQILPLYVCRIHKSYAVSLLQISKLDRQSVNIMGKSLPIGRKYRSNLLERLKHYSRLDQP